MTVAHGDRQLRLLTFDMSAKLSSFFDTDVTFREYGFQGIFGIGVISMVELAEIT